MPENPIYVTQAFLPPIEEYKAMLEGIWERHWVTNNGSLHNELTQALQDYLKVRNVTLFVNGHSALDVALKALDLSGEVITTPFTFASTTHAIVMNGLKPVFCDIKLSDYTIDEEKIESLITPQTSAIVAVHVYGFPCAVERIEAIAKKHGLKVIYDAAHAFGVEKDGVPIGTYGDVSMMSFHATKIFNTIEGGALLYGEDEYKKVFNLYKNFGITGPETVEAVGINAKMNEFQAAMGLCNLKYMDEQIRKRKVLAGIYRQALKEVPGIRFVEDMPGLKHNYAYFPILVEEEYGRTRDELFYELQERNIYPRKYFYPLVTDYECYRGMFDEYELPKARYVAERILTLPMYGELKPEAAEYIAECVRS